MVSCCVVFMTTPKDIQHMHGSIPFLFNFGTNPVVHLLLLKSFIIKICSVESKEHRFTEKRQAREKNRDKRDTYKV